MQTSTSKHKTELDVVGGPEQLAQLQVLVNVRKALRLSSKEPGREVLEEVRENRRLLQLRT